MFYDCVFVFEVKCFEICFYGWVLADEIVQNYMEMIQFDDWLLDVVCLIIVE